MHPTFTPDLRTNHRDVCESEHLWSRVCSRDMMLDSLSRDVAIPIFAHLPLALSDAADKRTFFGAAKVQGSIACAYKGRERKKESHTHVITLQRRDRERVWKIEMGEICFLFPPLYVYPVFSLTHRPTISHSHTWTNRRKRSFKNYLISYFYVYIYSILIKGCFSCQYSSIILVTIG